MGQPLGYFRSDSLCVVFGFHWVATMPATNEIQFIQFELGRIDTPVNSDNNNRQVL